MKKSIKLIALFVAFQFTAFSTFAQDKAQQIEQLLNKYNEYGQFNGSALVAENGKSFVKHIDFEKPNNFNTSKKEAADFEISGSAEKIRVIEALELAKQIGFPAWVDVSVDKVEGVFKKSPDRDEFASDVNESLIVELYSR